MLRIFLNTACGVTEPKEAAYAVTVLKSYHDVRRIPGGHLSASLSLA